MKFASYNRWRTLCTVRNICFNKSFKRDCTIWRGIPNLKVWWKKWSDWTSRVGQNIRLRLPVLFGIRIRIHPNASDSATMISHPSNFMQCLSVGTLLSNLWGSFNSSKDELRQLNFLFKLILLKKTKERRNSSWKSKKMCFQTTVNYLTKRKLSVSHSTEKPHRLSNNGTPKLMERQSLWNAKVYGGKLLTTWQKIVRFFLFSGTIDSQALIPVDYSSFADAHDSLSESSAKVSCDQTKRQEMKQGSDVVLTEPRITIARSSSIQRGVIPVIRKQRSKFRMLRLDIWSHRPICDFNLKEFSRFW